MGWFPEVIKNKMKREDVCMWFRERRLSSAGLFFVILVVLLFPSTGFSEVIRLSAIEVKSIVDMGAETYNYLIVDIRDEEQYKAGHIPGAVNMPADTLEAHLQSIPKDRNIIIYCDKGGKSADACAKIMARGYMQVYNASFSDWTQAGYRVERS